MSLNPRSTHLSQQFVAHTPVAMAMTSPPPDDPPDDDPNRVSGNLFQTIKGEAVSQGGPTGLKSRDYGSTYSGSNSQANLARRFSQLHGSVPFHFGEPQMLAMDHSEGIPLLEDYINAKFKS